MKLDRKARVLLTGGNVNVLSQNQKTPLKSSPYYSFLFAVAECLDAMCNGENLYITIGATQSHDALRLSINKDGSPTSVYAGSLEGLSKEIEEYLD